MNWYTLTKELQQDELVLCRLCMLWDTDAVYHIIYNVGLHFSAFWVIIIYV